MTFVRSLVFNLVYYLVTTAMVVASLPVFAFGSERALARVTHAWATAGIFLLRTIVGTRFVVRGLDNIPPGGAIIAPKHQSMFETFALFTVLDRPTYVMKQELARIPLWGWCARRAGMIMVERDQGTAALRRLAANVAPAIARNRQVIIFPEGTRRPPGAKPDYKGGVAHLYRMTGAPVVPVALNTGLFWPRRQIARYPGTIVFEFLPPIMPGLSTRDFLNRLKAEIEEASDRLLVEADQSSPRPPFPAEAAARLSQLTQG
jgi:1-acyl-sn-glycerol-3-phosphate acyltransferase